ncbi:thiamine/thiamine pyrophosphate ABC transporter permease [Rhizobium sp. EC-SD404]|uniref:thiamine/thiamine pyrophosphate ABC transporter permease n=1 Tax=Rhizobium sp. EC-SD404 TaxID=2038389 RepID=UPI0012568996|nr:thiamine/thiamine pyrophosphate ABC transporter permease [Rhizobium sp. EC-SD404]VVT03717.1 fused thiamin transporter subunits of ABC superfamily: membrane components [Rhizobium sp. EC-SD404]
MRAYRADPLDIAFGIAALAIILGIVGLAVAGLLVAAGADASRFTAFDAYTMRVVRFTLWQAGLSTLLSLAFALPLARALARRPHFAGRAWILRLFAVPLGLPAIVAALGIIAIWGRQGVVNDAYRWLGAEQPISVYGLPGILIAHVFFNMPLATRLLLAALERAPAEYWRNAAQLGLSAGSVFRLIEWPAMARVIPGIAGLVFMLCATSFTLVLLLGGGPGATTIEVAIYQALRFDFDPPRAVTLALIQIALTGALLGVLALLPRPEEGRGEGALPRRFDAKSPGALALDTLVIGLGLGFVAAPLAATLMSGLAADLIALFGEALVQRALVTSLLIASAAACLSVLMAGMIARARHAASGARRKRWAARGLRTSLAGAGSLILLVPPVVLGAGWFLVLRDHVDPFAAAPVIVVVVNALMALPFALRVLEPAYAGHMLRTERLSLSLGLSRLRRLLRVDLPALGPTIGAAFAFSMALSLGDLGAIALFGSQDLVTLPYLLLQRMGSYRTDDAAGLALILGFLCLLFMIAGTRYGGGSAREA